MSKYFSCQKFYFQNYSKIIFNDFFQLESGENLTDFTRKHLLFLRLNPEQLNNAVKRLEFTEEENSIESVSSVGETESEEVLTVDEDSNAGSTSAAYSNDISVAKST